MMKAKDYRNLALPALKQNEKVFMLASLIMLLITSVFLPLEFIETEDNLFLSLLQPLATGAVSILISSALQFALSKMALRALRNEEVAISQLADGFKANYGKIVVKALIESILFMLSTMLLIIPGIIMYYSLALSDFILADEPELSPTEAIEKSYDLMKGHRFELFRLDLSFAGWFLLELLTFGLFGLWVTPYHRISHAAFYRSLIKEKKKKYSTEDIDDEIFEREESYGYSPDKIIEGFDYEAFNNTATENFTEE